MNQLQVNQGTIQKFNQFQDLLERFLNSQDIKNTTLTGYRKNLKEFFKWLAENQIINPTRQDILDYKKHLILKELSSLTISTYLVTVRRFFQWLEIEEIYKDITKGLKGMKRSKGFKKDCLKKDQAISLLNSIQNSTLIGKRDLAMVTLMLYTGLRCCETQRANIEDIRQLENETVLYIQGKGRDEKDEFVILKSVVLSAINDYLNLRKGIKNNEALFSGCSNRNRNQRLTTTIISMTIKKYFRLIGLNSPRITAHSLRHSAATFCLKGGGSLQETQQLLRHVSIDTTLIYSHNLNRIKNNGEKAVEHFLELAVA